MTFQKVGPVTGPETWGLWQPARVGDLEESGFRGESQSRGRCRYGTVQCCTGGLSGHQARYEDICGGYDASSGWGPICTGHRPASQSPIQNLLGLFGSKAKAGTSQETDITGRPSPGGWGSKSAAQMAPRCGHPHGVGGTVKATTSAQTPDPAAGSPQPWPFPSPSQACQGHGSWSPAPGM